MVREKAEIFHNRIRMPHALHKVRNMQQLKRQGISADDWKPSLGNSCIADTLASGIVGVQKSLRSKS